MAKKKENGTYPIRATTYIKTPTGEIYPEDAQPKYLRGKRKYHNAVKKNEKVIDSSWGQVKQRAFDKSKNKEVSVRWNKPVRHIVSVTKELSDGTKEITYFNPVTKSMDK